ncbi:hypothetical protein PRIPAC_94547 [Pristionchus pacificus]|uniref:Uncharacterized protein n=1 Tax=Pristionchus pacificus TaxID=54126 RepID=A0A2A6BPB7_PRIPA|nr:hypothetical protein PRIPAC_94547 [Pristionchus pacificus]|eukprot:PDM67666.1 hypothetical protein PRIPAC_45710 [Pristionchus pacificus]
MSPSPASPSVSTTLQRVGATTTPDDKSNPTSPFRHIRNRHAPLIREVADGILQHNSPSPALPSIREVADNAHPLRTRLPSPIADVEELDQPIHKDAAHGRHPFHLEPVREVAESESAPAKKFHTREFLWTLLRNLRGR